MPPLHITTPVPRPFWLTWTFEPIPALAIAVVAIAYAAGLRMARSRGRRIPDGRRVVAFYAGLGTLALAMLGPFDAYADDSFFVHMLQHLAMLVVAAPLLLVGRPVQLAVGAGRPRVVRALSGVVGSSRALRGAVDLLASPWIVFTAFNLNLILWHLPRAYEAALRDEMIHEVEHALFFGTALLFWWIIIDPHPSGQRASPHAVFGLSLSTCLVGNVLAAAITLSPTVLYGWYVERDTNPFGLEPLVDQRLGGATMWLGGLIYFGVLFALLAREGRRADEAVRMG